jgi:hypothetical protein
MSKVLPLGALAVLASVGFLASGPLALAGQRSTTSCSTKGLAFSSGKKASYKVVQLGADGVTCSKARTVAQKVALELLKGKPISIEGVSDFGMSTISVGAGPAKTQISLTFANNGKITVSLTGGGGSSSSGGQLPTIPSNPFPTSPTTPSNGGGNTIVV